MTRIMLALIFLTAGVAARGEQSVLTLDPAQTTVSFVLDTTLHTVHGTFKLSRGVIRYDTSTGDASGEVVIDAASGASGNQGRDNRMHKSILESPKFAAIRFVPDHVQGQFAASGESDLQVHGIITLHGTDHETTLSAKVRRTPGGLSVTTDLVIPYVQWGLKNPSTFVLRVSDKVQVEIESKGRISPFTR